LRVPGYIGIWLPRTVGDYDPDAGVIEVHRTLDPLWLKRKSKQGAIPCLEHTRSYGELKEKLEDALKRGNTAMRAPGLN